MLCQICQQAKASIHTLDLHEGQWVQRHLCEKCALGAGPSTNPDAGKVIKFFGQILAQAETKGASQPRTPQDPETDACPGCGMTYEQFQQSRRLGCARCYETFGGDLEQIFLRVQEGTSHRGKVPGRPRAAPPSPLELRRLKENLQRAVEEERFEDAALFRDKIREICDDLEEPDLS